MYHGLVKNLYRTVDCKMVIFSWMKGKNQEIIQNWYVTIVMQQQDLSTGYYIICFKLLSMNLDDLDVKV